MYLFSSRLKILRKEKNLSQREVAKDLGYSRTTIANYEQGVRLPSADVLNKLADYFEVSLDYLVGRSNIRLGIRDYLSLNAASILLFVEPDSGFIIDCSPSALSLYGYTRQELINKTIFDLSSLPKREIKILMNKTNQKKQQLYYFKHKVADGKIVDVKASIISLKIRNKEIITFLIQKMTNSGEDYKHIIKHLITTLSNTGLYKTPYKINHSKNVSTLCCEIGKKLNLAIKNINALKISSLLHDIGELYIPADILNKPGQLTENEFKLIKDHPKYSYEIIKNIPFEEPIANIVLQHHERLDGSGYPNGLSNNNILLEAKIIAVADVIEAMTSNRPYRQALKLENALAELEKYSDIKYDKHVVDICLEIFKNNICIFNKHTNT